MTNAASFSANQEAYVTLSQVSASGLEQGLLLKTAADASAALKVVYVAPANVVRVFTYTSAQGWAQRGADISITMNNGDQLGARAKANGDVEVYRNGSLLGTVSVTAWTPYSGGGYIGLWYSNTSGGIVDDFGGGNVSASATPTNTLTSTTTNTPTITQTAENTPAITDTPTITLAPSDTSTPSQTPTITALTTLSPTGTMAASFTPSQTFTPSFTPTLTNTPVLPTATQTFTPPPSGPLTIDYTYDPLNRLTSATYSDGRSFGYTYDASGNVLELQQNLGPGTIITTYTYDEANQLNTAQQGSTTWQYTYDANGSLISDGVKNYTYDSANRLVEISEQSTVTSLSYNGLGQRLSMDADGVIAYYVMDGDRSLTAQSGGNTTFYLYGLDPIGEKTNTWNFALPDGLNTPRQLTDIQGDVTLSTRYTPWGDVLDTYGTGNFNYGYLGGLLDATTGLIYVGNGQYYDPSTGRFLTRSVNPDSTNPYTPWNPTGAILAPLAVLSLFYGRKRKRGKWDTVIVIVLLGMTVGIGVVACAPAPTQPALTPVLPPPNVTIIPASTQTTSPTEPPAPTIVPTQTPCPPPFTTDNSWGNSIAQKEAHVQILIPALSSYQGEKWWEGTYPTDAEWVGYLIYAEGEILKNREDKKLLAWILLYKIPRWGIAEYTPVTNPDVTSNFELNNFTISDWNRLVNPDKSKLQDAFMVLQETMLIHSSDDLPPYLYWVSKDEIVTTESITKCPIKFDYNYYPADTWDEEKLYFLQAYEDFAKVTSPKPKEKGKCE